MACFLVPAAEAVVVKAVEKMVKKSEAEAVLSADGNEEKEIKIPFSRKLNWLSNMLIGGVILLLFEHIWHGEVVPWFPFLTAMSSPSETAAMLLEMSTAGVCMAVLVTVVWAVMCFAADSIVNRKNRKSLVKGVEE